MLFSPVLGFKVSELGKYLKGRVNHDGEKEYQYIVGDINPHMNIPTQGTYA